MWEPAAPAPLTRRSLGVGRDQAFAWTPVFTTEIGLLYSVRKSVTRGSILTGEQQKQDIRGRVNTTSLHLRSGQAFAPAAAKYRSAEGEKANWPYHCGSPKESKGYPIHHHRVFPCTDDHEEITPTYLCPVVPARYHWHESGDYARTYQLHHHASHRVRSCAARLRD